MSSVKVIDKLVLSEAEELRFFGEVIVFSEIIEAPNWEDWTPFLEEGIRCFESRWLLVSEEKSCNEQPNEGEVCKGCCKEPYGYE